MRDFTTEECRARNEIKNKIENIFELWGYNEISTPTVEYYDNFNDKTKILKEEEMYKFFDNRGHILVLRPDMTVPAARMAGSKLKDMELPIKIRYSSNIYRVHELLAGVNNEYMDCGVEILGSSAEESDLEILVTAIESLKSIDRSGFKLEIGNTMILKSAMNCMNLKTTEKENIADLIEKKSLISLEEYLAEINISKEEKEFLIKLPWLFGGKEVFSKAKLLVNNESVLKNIDYLENLFNELKELGYEKYISIDMSMVPRLNYYTGIIFRGYKNNSCRNVLRGGRYDCLCKSFGRNMPAVGFSIGVDLFIDEYKDIKERSCEKIIVQKEGRVKAIQQALQLIDKGKKVHFIYEGSEKNEY